MDESQGNKTLKLKKRGLSYIFFLLAYLSLAIGIASAISFFSGFQVFGNSAWSVIMLSILVSGLLGIVSLVLYIIELKQKARIVHSELTLPLIIFVIFVATVLSAFWITIFARF